MADHQGARLNGGRPAECPRKGEGERAVAGFLQSARATNGAAGERIGNPVVVELHGGGRNTFGIDRDGELLRVWGEEHAVAIEEACGCQWIGFHDPVIRCVEWFGGPLVAERPSPDDRLGHDGEVHGVDRFAIAVIPDVGDVLWRQLAGKNRDLVDFLRATQCPARLQSVERRRWAHRRPVHGPGTGRCDARIARMPRADQKASLICRRSTGRLIEPLPPSAGACSLDATEKTRQILTGSKARFI